MKEKTNRLYNFNGFELEVDEGLLRKGQDTIPLTPKAFDTLIVLLKNRGKVVDKEVLLNEVWADTFVEETTLAQNIFTLRKALGTLENGKQLIETVPRRGYKFVAEVSEIIGTEETLIVQRNIHTEITAEHSIHDSDGLEVREQENFSENFGSKLQRLVPQFLTKSFNRILSAGLVLLAIIPISYGLFSYFQTAGTAGKTASPVISSIAVLPFQTIGEQSREEKLGFGMADAIITRLSKLQKIPVRPTSAIFRYIEQPALNTTTAGRDLGVDAILEGSVQRDGDRVRVTVQLTSVADGKPLWAETIDEKDTNIFALQDAISSKVVQSLSLKLTPQQWKTLEERMTDKPEAFEAYQLGVYFWNFRSKDNLLKAVNYFQKAIEIDPNFAAAYGLLADTYSMIGYYRFADTKEMMVKARAAAEKSLALNDSVAQAQIAMSYICFFNGDTETAKRYIERAIQIDPYNSTAHIRYSWILFRTENLDQAFTEMQLGQQYDPLSPISNGALCSMLIYREKFGEAVKFCEKAVELSSDAADNRLSLANAYFFSGRTEDGIKLAKLGSEKTERKFSALATLGYFYARTGNHTEAKAIVERLKSEAEKDSTLFSELTLVTYALDRKDESFSYFKKAYELRLVRFLEFKYEPVWREIRLDSRFCKLMEEPS
jgi:TolB-like protein/DNA-binding winged helix-turn-helix (wHTH) protein/Flp pilus assembly protein TadD